SDAVNALLQWIDARGVLAHALRKPTDEEAQRPMLYRYWRALPANGHVGIFFGTWDGAVLAGRALGEVGEQQVEAALQRFTSFERMLPQENTLLVKLWLHLTRKAMKKRLKKQRADPATAWRVTKEDRKLLRHYDELRAAGEHMIRRTDSGEAPWTII